MDVWPPNILFFLDLVPWTVVKAKNCWVWGLNRMIPSQILCTHATLIFSLNRIKKLELLHKYLYVQLTSQTQYRSLRKLDCLKKKIILLNNWGKSIYILSLLRTNSNNSHHLKGKSRHSHSITLNWTKQPKTTQQFMKLKAMYTAILLVHLLNIIYIILKHDVNL